MVDHPTRKAPFPLIRIAVILVACASIASLAMLLIRTQAFGIFSIRGEAYYPELVKRIATDRAFLAALGSPISVDASGVVCDYKTFDTGGVTQKASCYIPVSGPKQSGNVHAQILSRPGALDADLFLHIGDKVVRGTP